jgi:lipopolysaccharide transport system ATP-binding protein
MAMAIHFRNAGFGLLQQFTLSAPDGAFIGVLGEDNSGQRELLRLAAGLDKPDSGEVIFDTAARLIGPSDPLNLSPVPTLLLDHTFALHDHLVRARAAVGLDRLRRNGSTILLCSHEIPLLVDACDEIWWLQEGRLAAKGDPREVSEKYLRHIAARQREWGARVSAPLSPSMRRGDGRACIQKIETLGESGRPTMVLRSGEPAEIRVSVRFEQAVENPVVGIMIRTRIGFEVFGTNTELEKVRLGPVAAAQTLTVSFRFRCDLCPQEYTLTAASHDPDGVWHDWLEDAIAFSVADSRYTAGVANLRASASVMP